MDNNHPVQHGDVVGVHNGVIVNDEELFRAYGVQRYRPGMTVDSEAIFMLANQGAENIHNQLFGTYSAAWMKAGEEAIHILRGGGRPLHIIQTSLGVIWASTYPALASALVATGHGNPSDIQTVSPGTSYLIQDYAIIKTGSFTPRMPAKYVLPLYDDQLHLQERAAEVLQTLLLNSDAPLNQG
jgi:asparagine synthetase B (glutamine-hydrolysing)